MENEEDQETGWLEQVVDEACAPVLEEAVAPHLPAIRAALRDVDTTARPTPAEIIERIRLNGLDDREASA